MLYQNLVKTPDVVMSALSEWRTSATSLQYIINLNQKCAKEFFSTHLCLHLSPHSKPVSGSIPEFACSPVCLLGFPPDTPVCLPPSEHTKVRSTACSDLPIVVICLFVSVLALQQMMPCPGCTSTCSESPGIDFSFLVTCIG